jgi:enoyl-CoA hydratase
VPTLTLDTDGALRVLTLSRPELLNRFDAALHHDFTSALTEVARDPDARALVVTSTGKVFSAGGDFELMRSAHSDPAVRRAIVDDAKDLLTALLSLPQPVVVAVQGAAMGLAATIVVACDAVVAARSAVLADSHVNVGLVAGDGGAVLWPTTAGALRARRHLLTGDPLDAETAFTLGMVTDLVDEPEQALPAALEIARRMATLPPLAVRLTKRALNHGLLQRAGEVLELSLAYEEATLASDDLLEAISAFHERRPGDYRGR